MGEEQKGWVYSWRNDVLNEWKGLDDSLFRVLIWCLHKMAVTKHFVYGFGLLPGQFLTGRFRGAEEIGWKWKNDKIREKKGSLFYRKLQKLKELGKIDTRKVFVPDTTGFHDITLVTVYNHLHYLNPSKEEKHTAKTHQEAQNTSEPIKEERVISKDITLGESVVKKKPKSKPREETKPLITYFSNKYKEKFSEPYHISWAKDSSCIKRLLDSGFTATTLFKLIDMFINDEDSFLDKVGHTIPLFSSRINRYIEQMRNTKPDIAPLSGWKPKPEEKTPKQRLDEAKHQIEDIVEYNRCFPEPKEECEKRLKLLTYRIALTLHCKDIGEIPDELWTLIHPKDGTNPNRKH